MSQILDLGLVKGEPGKDGVQVYQYALLFPASDWMQQEDGRFTQLVAADTLETDYGQTDLDMSSVTKDTYADVSAAWSLVARAQTQNGGLLLTCYGDVPEIDLPVRLEVLR